VSGARASEVPPLEVRRVRAGEWASLRQVRLRALAESPEAFATTFEEARTRPEGWWRRWAARSAERAEQAMFLAWEGDPAGIGGAFAEQGGFRVISLWVEPGVRGRGIGRALLDAAVAFAGEAEVRLSVADGNDSARRLYERYGFVDTGLAGPLRPGSTLLVRELRLER
jgi:ribosomal protein S18 acetylase RimI-like enzyme